MVLAELERAREQLIHVNALADYLARRRGFTLVNEVATTKLFRAQTDCVRNLIHVPFLCEDALRRAKTSEGAMRRNVSSDSATVYPDIRTEVWTSGVDGS